jgi:primosomal protein N' (replication factor Y)
VTQTQTFIETILPLPIRGFFTYLVPENLVAKLAIGQRVLVQFGQKKLYTALVFNIHNKTPEGYEVKPIIDIIDDVATVNKYQIRLWEWGADYYMCSIGEFFKAALPAGLRLESETKILAVENYMPENALSSNQQMVLNALKNSELLTLAEISNIAGIKNPIPLIKE